MSVPNVFAVAGSDRLANESLERYLAIRRTTEALTEDLTPEDQMIQSMPETSPTKWHLAHTTWFFETFILKPRVADYTLFHRDFTFLFNSYYKALGSHPNRVYRNLFSRPSLDQVRDYRRHVDRHMLQLISGSMDRELHSLLQVGLNHEQQHQELIVTDIKHGLWSNPLRPAWKQAPPRLSIPPAPLNWIDFDENIYSIGFGVNGFSFDNETPRHQVFLDRSSIASRLVTNADYLAFIRDGGYLRPELWLSDGWDTINAQRWIAPLYWEERDGLWYTYTVGGIRELDLHEPVCHLSFYEADAYARWSGARLPTEAEWEVAAFAQPIEGNFLESGRLHPLASGSSQFFGDVWEWTASPYTAYPGFHPATGALGEYNGKFMVNQMVLRGGSCATPQSHIRPTYRNFFPPSARWQFTGLRLAK